MGRIPVCSCERFNGDLGYEVFSPGPPVSSTTYNRLVKNSPKYFSKRAQNQNSFSTLPLRNKIDQQPEAIMHVMSSLCPAQSCYLVLLTT